MPEKLGVDLMRCLSINSKLIKFVNSVEEMG